MLTLILIVLAVAQNSERPSASEQVMLASPRSDGLAAWQQVYSVMVSPRCLNCHTATNYPQQGDDRHRHVANVIRGPQDKGVVAFELLDLSSIDERGQHRRSRRAQLASRAAVDEVAGRE